MKLKYVVVSGFKSVKSVETLLVDERITVLIGANDHGKSNLLDAIRRLDPDLPIALPDRNSDLPKDEEPRIEWHFVLTEEELTRLAAKHRAKPSKQVTTNGQDGQAAEPAANADAGAAAVPAEAPLFETNSLHEIVYVREGVDGALEVLSVPFAASTEKESHFLALLPKVESFLQPISTNLRDNVSLSELETDDFEFMQGIFHLAGLWDHRRDLFAQNPRTSKLLDDASKALTAKLNDEWNQGRDLGWKLEHSGTNGDHIVIQIKDPAIEREFSRPSIRSSGFQTFFVLSMMINARTHRKPSDSYIFLFDEPGTYLHPYAQLDLQRSFETMADKAQIVYSTHALFLISKNYPNRNRVISKTREGTKIDQKPFQRNWKSVRESLGILLSNNFLIADKTLLVEGPSDIIYMLHAIRTLKRKGVADIDLNDLSVVDAGDSTNYVAMAKLMLSEGRAVVALLDGDAGGDSIMHRLQRVCAEELHDEQLKVHQLPRNKSIEDLICHLPVMHEAILTLCNELIESHERSLAEDLNLDDAIKQIKLSADGTLGHTIRTMTNDWFSPKDPLSKLSIALLYEKLVEAAPAGINAEGVALVNAVKQLMELKGEKSAEPGVFEEVD
jgi:predicted ATP-dependent endonuclease of OLD family